MSKLLSFFGGVAKGFSEEIDKSEKYGRETSLAQMKRLAENYEKVREENSKIANELKGVEDWVKTNYQDATPEQIAFLQGSPAALKALQKMEDPTKYRLNDIISIATGNENKNVAAKRISELPEYEKKVSETLKAKGFFAREFEGAGERAAATAEQQFANAFGVDAETMRALKPIQRPSVEGTFDIAKTLEKTPDSVESMVKSANVERVQAKQKFGEDSPEYKAANEKFVSLSSEIEKSDKTLEARASRLNLAIMDTTDPAEKKALQAELKNVQDAIKTHREATSTRSERAQGDGADKTTLAKVSRSVSDFVNTRMRQDMGFEWNKHVDFKQITLPDGSVYTSPSVKTTLPVEKQREVFDMIARLEAQALTTNGYVVGGKPRYNEVQEFINNKNIPREYYTNTGTASSAAATPEGLGGRKKQTPQEIERAAQQPVKPAPATPAPTAAAPKVDVAQVRREADAAIAKGADRATIAARFKALTEQEY